MSYQGQAVTLLPGRLRGYRQWTLVDLTGGGDFVLQSISVRADGGAPVRWPWTPRIEARCHRGSMTWGQHIEHSDDDVPVRECVCGIYAKHSPYGMDIGKPVSGVIEGWGPHTEIGDQGFRSRYARISALWVPSVRPQSRESDRLSPGWHEWKPPSERTLRPEDQDPTDWVRERLSEIYKVPVFDSFAALVEQYPPVDLSEIIPGYTRSRSNDEPSYASGGIVRSSGPRSKADAQAFLNATYASAAARDPIAAGLYPYPRRSTIGPGCWYVARLGTAAPDMTVTNGRFDGFWPMVDWVPVAVVNAVEMGHDGTRGILIPRERQMMFRDALYLPTQNVPGAACKMMLGWESADDTQRMIFHQVIPSANGDPFVINLETCPIPSGTPEMMRLYMAAWADSGTAPAPHYIP